MLAHLNDKHTEECALELKETQGAGKAMLLGGKRSYSLLELLGGGQR